ncbi:MAG: hypothetical protein LIP01_05540 [Tannerellaceae bacterium]|nr:hypothetical protein [Tannerellaceae bacterium]
MYFSLVPKGYRLLRKPEIFLEFYGRNFVKVASNKLLLKNVFLDRAKKRKSVIGHKFINNTEFNTYIKELLRGQNAFLCCRYGSTELKACFYAELCERSFTESVSDENLSGLKSASGVFPPREDVYLNFARIYKEAIAAADLNAYWGTILMEEYILKQQLKCDCILYAMRALEPFQYETPWTRELKGKKVVVVHPFSELIKSQYYARGGYFLRGKLCLSVTCE